MCLRCIEIIGVVQCDDTVTRFAVAIECQGSLAGIDADWGAVERFDLLFAEGNGTVATVDIHGTEAHHRFDIQFTARVIAAVAGAGAIWGKPFFVNDIVGIEHLDSHIACTAFIVRPLPVVGELVIIKRRIDVDLFGVRFTGDSPVFIKPIFASQRCIDIHFGIGFRLRCIGGGM